MTLEARLALGGLVVAVLGIILGYIIAYFFYRRSVRTKVLAIAYTAPIPVLLTLEDIEVSYQGMPLKALSRSYVLLWNRGTSPIESSDFISPIQFNYKAPLLKLEILDKDAAAHVKLDSVAKTLEVDLLRPGEAVLLHSEVASEESVPDINVEMKSAEMSASIGGYRGFYPSVVGFLFCILCFAIEMAILYPHLAFETVPPTVPDPNPVISFKMTVFVILFFALPFVAALIPIWFLTKFLERSNRVVWRFSRIKMTTVGVKNQVAAFRKYMSNIKNK
jgi:hypothetical protein